MKGALSLLLAGAVATAGALVPGAAALERPPIAAEGNQIDPAVVFTGTTYLVAWLDSRVPANGSLTPTGPPPPPPPPAPPPPPPPPRASLAAARLTSNGKLLDPGGVAIATTKADVLSEPAVVSAGPSSLVVWAHLSAQTNAIYASRISPAGSVLAPAEFPLAETPYPARYLRSPDAAFDGRNYLVVWTESERYGAPQVVGVRLTPDGTVLDTARIPIATGQSPAVAFDGRNYLVVAWEYAFPATSRLVATRVTPSGTVLDTTPIVLASSLGYEPTPALAFNGTHYLAVWVRREGVGQITIRATRVTRDGAVLDPGGVAIAGLGQHSAQPTIASDGANYLVAWADARFGCCSVYGTRVDAAGNALDPAGIAIATRGREQMRPASAFDGTNYLVAWDDNRASTTDVYAARVARSGRLLDPRGILLSTKPPAPARCVAPRVLGMRLARAKARIRRANCSVGRVRRTKAKRVGRVVAQSPRPGSVRRRGFPVRLVVGRR